MPALPELLLHSHVAPSGTPKGRIMGILKNLAWIVVAAGLVALVVVSRDSGYARDAVGALDAQHATQSSAS